LAALPDDPTATQEVVDAHEIDTRLGLWRPSTVHVVPPSLVARMLSWLLFIVPAMKQVDALGQDMVLRVNMPESPEFSAVQVDPPSVVV
jgi:hypothetical protein